MSNDTDKRFQKQRQLGREQTGQQLAQQHALQSQQSKVENPDFLDEISSLGLTSDKYAWLREELPGLFARANFIAERSESYEQEAKWLNQNRVERKIAMHSPGRLTKAVELSIPGLPRYPVLALAQRVTGRTDKELREEMHPDDREALRTMAPVATNYHSNAVGGAGRRAVSEATAVSRTETQEEANSLREKAAAGVWD